MGQHSSSGRVGRHRQENLHRHRAPAFPGLFATRSRSALSVTALSATLAAGVGVAGVAASASPVGGGGSGLPTAAHATAALPIVAPPGDDAPAKHLDPLPEETGGGPAAAPVRLKKRPVPPAAAWVNPIPAAQTTSCFGPRWGRLHAGVDLAAPHGTPIFAVGAGTVVTAGDAQGYGNAVLIDHGNGYLTHYGHMATITVNAGQKLAAGTQIGTEGSTGHSTGPHLHFEVHEGSYQNPIEPTAWMHERGVDIGGCAAPEAGS